MNRHNEDIIRDYCDMLWNQHDISAIRKWSAEGGVLHDYPGKSEVMFPDEIERRLAHVFTLIPDHHLDIIGIWSDDCGDVVWRWRVTGTWEGPWNTGASLDFDGITWYTLRNGKIVRRYGVSDAYLFDSQIGKISKRIDVFMP